MIDYQEILHSSRGFQPRKVTTGARRPRPYPLSTQLKQTARGCSPTGWWIISDISVYATCSDTVVIICEKATEAGSEWWKGFRYLLVLRIFI